MMGRMKNLLQRNVPAKVIALVVAITLWAVVMEEQNPFIESSATLDVTLLNQPEGYRVTPQKEQVKIRIRGQRSAFLAIEDSESPAYIAYVDLQGYGEGTHLLKPQITLPAGLELLEVQPEALSFNFDAIASKDLPIDLIISGATAPGTAVAKISQQDSSLTVTGPKSFLTKAVRVVGYVGLAGNDSDFSLKVPLTAINEDGREVPHLALSKDSTKVEVQLARGLSKKILTVKPVLGEGLPKGYVVAEVRVDPAKIEVAGDEKIISGLSMIATEPISLENMVASFNRTVKLVIPPGIAVPNPAVTVNVRVEEKAPTGEEPKEAKQTEVKSDKNK